MVTPNPNHHSGDIQCVIFVVYGIINQLRTDMDCLSQPSWDLVFQRWIQNRSDQCHWSLALELPSAYD